MTQTSTETRISENEIRSALRNYFKRSYTPPPVIAEEVSINSWQRRVDMLAVFKTLISAIEIKSDFDSMKRLAQQTSRDINFFDKAVVVTTERMVEKIPKDFNFTKSGLWIAKRGRNGIYFQKKIKAPQNYTTSKLDLAVLIPKTRLATILSAAGIKCAHCMTRSELELSIDNASIWALREEVLSFFRQRYTPDVNQDMLWSSDA